MLVTDFDYDLPQELIAQHPMEPRDHSRLLVVDKKTEYIQQKINCQQAKPLKHLHFLSKRYDCLLGLYRWRGS